MVANVFNNRKFIIKWLLSTYQEKATNSSGCQAKKPIRQILNVSAWDERNWYGKQRYYR